MRYRRQEEVQARVTDYLAWPVHILMTADDLDKRSTDLREFAQISSYWTGWPPDVYG